MEKQDLSARPQPTWARSTIAPLAAATTPRRSFMPAGAKRPVRVPIVEHVPPDVTAAIFWLNNRKPVDRAGRALELPSVGITTTAPSATTSRPTGRSLRRSGRSHGRCPDERRSSGDLVAVEIAADGRDRPPLFAVAYSPKAPQKWLEKSVISA
jgi:hypothetical protein